MVRTDGPMLFVNQGGGKFRQRPDAFHFAQPPQGTFTGAAVADYDRDGWLDIYFCLYLYYQGTDQYKYPSPYYDAENGPPNFMMRNQRDGTFRDVTAQTGLNKNNTRYSFCCGWSDYNRDGWPDLYVVNDFGRKNLYRNNGDGTFTDVAAQAGVEDVGAGWACAGSTTTMTAPRTSTWPTCGQRRAPEFRPRKYFRKTRPKRCALSTANMPAEIPCFVRVATVFRTPARPPESRWADGHGHAMPGILTMTAFLTFTSPTEWCQALCAMT